MHVWKRPPLPNASPEPMNWMETIIPPRSRIACARLFGANGLLPPFEELEPFGLVQVDEEGWAHRDGPEAAAHCLLQRGSGGLALHVRPDGEEESLVSDDLLPATGEQVIEEYLGRVRVLRRLGNEGDPRHHQRVVLGVDCAKRWIALLLRQGVGRDHVETDQVLAGLDSLEHQPGAGVELRRGFAVRLGRL